MQVQIGPTRLELVEGDITEQHVDAVVNAAHPDLLGGQGVDGAIHFKGGPEIAAECRKLAGCPTGCAVITRGGALPARFVIHAVGPVYHPERDESAQLARTYRNALRIAAAYGLASIALPSISTGAFVYPLALAAPIALRTTLAFLRTEDHPLELVRFVLYPREGRNPYARFATALTALL